MTSRDKVRGLAGVPFAILALAVIFKWGPVPKAITIIVILASLAILLPRVWAFLEGDLEKSTLLSNLTAYSLLTGLVWAEYLFLGKSFHGHPKEDLMFLTAWLLMGIFEFLWPGFARKLETRRTAGIVK